MTFLKLLGFPSLVSSISLSDLPRLHSTLLGLTSQQAPGRVKSYRYSLQGSSRCLTSSSHKRRQEVLGKIQAPKDTFRKGETSFCKRVRTRIQPKALQTYLTEILVVRLLHLNTHYFEKSSFLQQGQQNYDDVNIPGFSLKLSLRSLITFVEGRNTQHQPPVRHKANESFVLKTNTINTLFHKYGNMMTALEVNLYKTILSREREKT